MNFLIGLDIGSSSVKVGLIDEQGGLLAIANHPYTTAEPSPGYKEQDPADWWDAVTKGIREVLSSEGKPSILAIGITGYISSLTFVDTDGRPLRPAIGFQDQRAFAEVASLAEFYSRSELASMLAIDLPPAPTWPLPKLLWMRRHESTLLDRARYLLQAKDYINLQLTGEIASDLSSNRGMVNFSNNRPATDIFERLDLPNILPPLLPPQSVIGHVTAKAARATGLTPGVPVIVGWNDLNACVLGSGIVRDGQTFDVTGTSEHIGIVTSLFSSAEQLICAPYLPGKHLLYGVMSTGGGSLQWFRKFSRKSIDELLAITSASAAGLLFLPYLEGERSPIWDTHASGVLLGLRSVHNEGDVARAILEGVAFSLRQNLEILEAHALVRPDIVIASGGASRIQLWNQIKANVIKRDVVTLRNPHAGIHGAAILAAVAVGMYPDIETAAVAMTQMADKFGPQPHTLPHMDRMYTLFNQVYPALQGTLSQLNAETLSMRNEAKAMTTTRRAVVFGAGKIARGFISHLLTLSGYRLTFVEKNPELVDLLHRRGKYRVEIMGAPEKSITIQNFDIYHVSEVEAVAQAIANASVVFVSIGGPNLPQIAPLLAAGLECRDAGINIVLGENYFQPAQWLRLLISEELSPAKRQWFAREVGIVESMILRSTIEPTDEMKALDPLSLKAQDMWEIPADKDAFVGEIPPIQGLSPKDNFQGGLIRKLFTYNCLNAIIAYMGHLRGYVLLSDAANDSEIVELAREAYRETGAALCQRYGFDPEEQKQFAAAAIAKYQRREIVDPIERNARDPLRKLARNDRLVGPACLAVEYGTKPTALSRGIAAAFLYSSPKDLASLTLQQIVQSKGIRAALGEVCKIDTTGELADLIVNSYEILNDNALR
jgi:sugar (pentulose or hexulose) kinase/mannitol-1-phosphate/altronate dehydrogenase